MKFNQLALSLLFSISFTIVSAQTQFTANDNASKFENKLDFSRPISGKSGNISTYRRYATNANRPGVVQIGLGYGSVIGGAKLTLMDPDTTETEKGLGLTTNFGLRMQIGVSELISTGFYIRKDMGSYIAGFDKFDLSGVSFGFEGKVYAINKDKFAVYVAPSIGYSFANSNIYFPDSANIRRPNAGKGLGLNYGLTAGLNWYWTDNLGMSCDLGYVGSSVLGVFNSIKLAGLTYNLRYSGFYFGVGLVIKFDGISVD